MQLNNDSDLEVHFLLEQHDLFCDKKYAKYCFSAIENFRIEIHGVIYNIWGFTFELPIDAIKATHDFSEAILTDSLKFPRLLMQNNCFNSFKKLSDLRNSSNVRNRSRTEESRTKVVLLFINGCLELFREQQISSICKLFQV
ncbi:hypothetical protein CWI36_0223p0010 [Hamiltosporidium magnivora]|uniref:Uncharacterized protein n=1 Tax=Hamiltosporidium magnivora TaxID=148818 RepID=A0A4Q9LKF7_9MICR|nr:hypothetical protein CWI36_0223p0010 [Hamiltosporidium magnivora]